MICFESSYCNTGQYRFVCPTFLSICEFLNPTFYSFTEISFVIFQRAICHDIHQWFFVVIFLMPFLNVFFFWCVHLQHLTCTTFYQTGATYYLPALKLAAFFEPSKMDGWKLEYWYYVYIYIFIYSLGHFGLFSGVNSLAVSGRNRR